MTALCIHLLLLILVTETQGQTTRESHVDVNCETTRPADCTEERPTNCADENVQIWLPQNNIGVPGACGRCFYCKTTPTFVMKEQCPLKVCPIISPLCNKVKPAIVLHDGRRCRGCSECISYNNCPQQNCPRRIRRCEVYRPNYRYINGELCPACRVCSRYQGDFNRPPSTPLPCPAFNITTCPLVDDCVQYNDRYVNMGENRRCQVCPECLQWRDPNDDIPHFNLGTTPNRPNTRRGLDGGNDGVSTQRPPQTCPDLSRCPSLAACEGEIVNKTLRIPTNEICPWCSSCSNSTSSIESIDCPPKRCPGVWCSRTAIYTKRINDTVCEVCVCTDINQNCSSPFLVCPPVECAETVPGSVIVEDHICSCPVCKTRRRNEPDGGFDMAQPDERNRRPHVLNNMVLPTVVTTPTVTNSTTIQAVTNTIPNCEDIVPGMICPQVTCIVVVADILTVNGIDCYSCQRCVSDIATGSKCPTFNCPTVDCGDNEDIAFGRRYRLVNSYNVSGEICDGCNTCLDCPIPQCPERLDPRCERYTRRTDRRGCVLCPFCERWDNAFAPPILNLTGFIQSVSSAECITAHGNFSNALPGLVVDTCAFNTDISTQEQVWIFTDSGLMQDASSKLCISYYSTHRPLVMRLCNTRNPNMLWTLEKDNRFPQFFRIRHPRWDQCLDIAGPQLGNSSTQLVLNSCEALVRTGQEWSGQWWKFEQF